jgi:hypothetical protein
MKLRLAIIIFSFLLVLQVAYAADSNVRLETGWNLISSPVSEGYSINIIKEHCAVRSGPWSWTGIEYDKASKITPFQGVWIKVSDSCSYNVPGTQITSTSEMQLDKGWNLISWLGNIDETKGSCEIKGGPWSWDAKNQEYKQVNDLDASQGYWVNVDADCTLGITTGVDLPDLTVGEIILSPTPPFSPGTKFTIQVIILNQGKAPVTTKFFNITLLLDGKLVEEFTGSDYVMGPGARLTSWSYDNEIDTVGLHTIEVITDVHNAIPESNEGNNRKIFSFLVS